MSVKKSGDTRSIVEEEFTEEDYERAQAKLERLEEPLRSGAESDHVLYQSLQAIMLCEEPEEIKESMVVCLLEKFFLRVSTEVRN